MALRLGGIVLRPLIVLTALVYLTGSAYAQSTRPTEPTRTQIEMDVASAEADLRQQSAAAHTQFANMARSVDRLIDALRLKEAAREREWAEYSKPLWK